MRRKLDPDGTDTALDRMVIVGHSMGGLLSKMMATEAGDRLWRVISDRPFGELLGEKADIDLFRSGLFFGARPEVRRVVYIATPHRGSRFDRGPIEQLGTRLVRVPDPLRRPITGWWRATSRHSSGNISARPCRPASTSWNGDRRS